MKRTLLLLGIVLAAGCQQKMAQQPYYKPLEETSFFPDGRSARPLERGVVHRGQHLDSDPLVTGLTPAEWKRFWDRDTAKVDASAATLPEDRTKAFGAPRFDPRTGQPHSNADVQIYTTEFPFELTERDLSIGGDRYSTYCAVCHGPLGNGKGKIWERGFLKPTSYHTEPVEKFEPVEKRTAAGAVIPQQDWEKTDGAYFDLGTGSIPLGFSRGYWKWDIQIPVRDVPPGYIFEVITKGYGAMPDHASQIKPEDRWRIIAYIRTLQFSRRADASKPEVKKALETAGGSHK